MSLTDQQRNAIALAARIGDDIRKRYPGIAGYYRSGMTAPRIVAHFELSSRYGVSERFAANAVRNALRGYCGPLHPQYDGLIRDLSERERLALEHDRQSGIEEYHLKRGIHALTPGEKAEFGRRGGLIRGPLSYRLKIGCHGLPPEVLREHCKKIAPLGGKAGAIASAIARGLVPFVPAAPGRISELEFAFRLASNPEYQGPVRTDFRKIAGRVNEVYHAGRPRHTRATLKNALRSYASADGSPADPELAFASRLRLDSSYQLPARIKATKIAREVNEKYHEGKAVRSGLTISRALRRYRKALRTNGTEIAVGAA